MDQSSDITNFEQCLKKNIKKRTHLYNNSKKLDETVYKPKDVLINVSTQLKAIQKADVVKCERKYQNNPHMYGKSGFLSLNQLPVNEEVSKQRTPANKFETQSLIDTQLMNIIENAEALNTHKGVTLEFDHSFSHIESGLNNRVNQESQNLKINCDKSSKSIIDKDFNNTLASKIAIDQDNDNKVDDNGKEREGNNINTQTNDSLNALLNSCIEINEENSERPMSPIFNHIKPIKRSSNSTPLVYTLKSFEEFEKIAVPLIEDNMDMDKAKHFINSQIMGKELFLNDDIGFAVEQLSPVLEIKKEKDKEVDEVKEKDNDEAVVSKTYNNSLEDEILFSSDEEMEYIHKELQDLPFTCALETSFYDTSDVLDKTMYVGFQTASNKSIQINSDSFTKAQSILTDFDKDFKRDPSLTELVEVCDGVKCDNEQNEIDCIVKAVEMGFDEEIEINEDNIKSDEYTKAKKITDDKMMDILQCKEFIPDLKQIPRNIDTIFTGSHKKTSKRNFDEFTTSCNKRIKLSEQALARCIKVIQDTDLDEVLDTQTNQTEIYSKNKEVLTSNNDISKLPKRNMTERVENEPKLEDKEMDNLVQDKINDDVIIQEFENIEMSLEEDKSTKEDNFLGFKTASKKEITISNNALKKCQQIFQDIDFSEQIVEEPSKDGKKLEPKTHNINIEACKEQSVSRFPAFFTASNKQITISEQALANTTNIFKDLDQTDLVSNNIPKESKQVNETLMEIDYNQPSTSKENFIGFKTANNKDIKISNVALAKTKNIFKDIDEEEPAQVKNRDTYSFKESKTAGNKQVDVFGVELAKNIILCQDEDYFNQIDILPSKELDLDFRKSNDKTVNVSEQAFVRSRRVFQDINVINKDKNTSVNKALYEIPADFQGFKTASNKAVNISTEALAKTKKIFQDITINSEDPVKNVFQGLKPASDKVSNNVSQSMKLFQDVDSTYFSKVHPIACENKVDNAVNIFPGFKRANNKAVKISVEALVKSKKLFQNIDLISDEMPLETKSNSRNEANFAFQGFKTASNKAVKISDEALVKNKKLFQNIDLISDEMPLETKSNSRNEANFAFQGFKTASNKAVKISDEALVKSKELFQNINLISDEMPLETKSNSRNEANFAFQGFKTASNKAVKISDEALAKSKKVFQDIDSTSDEIPLETKSNSRNEANLGFQGFKTASNKAVKISDEALVKSMKLFQNIDLISDEMPLETKSNSRNEANLPFKGFKTASNKAVKISDEALLKSKKLFQDIDSKNDEIPLETKNNSRNEANLPFKGFKTASHKAVKISDEALVKSKKLFQDIDSTSDENLETNVKFKGFMTAYNKTVKIIDQALAKSKKVFKDIDLDIKNDSANLKFEGFKTGNNIAVEISEKALATSRKVFDDIGCSQILNTGIKGFQTANKQGVNISEDEDFKRANNTSERILVENDYNSFKIDAKPKCDIVGIIDTQVLNDFEETVYTEDFRNSPKRNKRSGSPILSCPRAKKRRFETPYKIKEITTEVAKTKEIVVNENQRNFIFDATYKKNKRYTLKDLLKSEDGTNRNTDKYILSFNFDNLLEFEFDKERNDITDHILTIKELIDVFLSSVNKNLIPKRWIENHLQLIIWKLISYEIKFPCTLKKVCTAKNVIDQLKYRYDRELYNARRPVLRKILEKDDTSLKTMVLCVVQIFVDGVKVDSVTNITNNIELLLTDGWYSVKASIDKMLSKLVCDEKIVVGTKIVTIGAELMNCEQGIAPWEDTSLVRLKIFGNSTRRARWDARLGCHGNAAMLTHLSSVKLDGGKVSKLRVLVTRVYPALYVEKFEDGSTVTRSERLEHLHQMKFEAERQVLMEKLYEEVEKEFADQESQYSEGLLDASNSSSLDSGSQITKMMKNSKDPEEFKNNLTHSQHCLLNQSNQNTNAHRERLLQEIQDRIREKMAKNGLCASRSVIPVLKIRVAGVEDTKNVQVTKGMISIWKPNDAIQEIITEGAWIDVINVVPTAIRYSEIQISAGRQSVFSLSKYKESEKIKPYTNLLKRKCYHIKDLATNPTSTTDYNEIDTVGMIFLIDPSIIDFESLKAQTFQNVYYVACNLFETYN